MRITETVFGTKEWLELFGKEAELNQFEEESGEVRLKVMRKIGGHVLTDYGDVGIDKESFTKRFKGITTCDTILRLRGASPWRIHLISMGPHARLSEALQQEAVWGMPPGLHSVAADVHA